MMARDSSIYSWNGVGGAAKGFFRAGETTWGAEAPQESRCVLLLFFCWASCFC